MLPGAGLAVTPRAPKIRWLQGLERCTDVLRGICECSKLFRSRNFCLFECHIRSWEESILKSWGSAGHLDQNCILMLIVIRSEIESFTL